MAALTHKMPKRSRSTPPVGKTAAASGDDEDAHLSQQRRVSFYRTASEPARIVGEQEQHEAEEQAWNMGEQLVARTRAAVHSPRKRTRAAGAAPAGESAGGAEAMS